MSTILDTPEPGRDKLRELWEKPTKEWSDDDLVGVLVARYRSTVVPPCRVCGAELSIQAIGGRSPTIYACAGYVDDEVDGRLVYKEGRSCADTHYTESRWEDHGNGDEDVIEALRRWRR